MKGFFKEISRFKFENGPVCGVSSLSDGNYLIYTGEEDFFLYDKDWNFIRKIKYNLKPGEIIKRISNLDSNRIAFFVSNSTSSNEYPLIKVLDNDLNPLFQLDRNIPGISSRLNVLKLNNGNLLSSGGFVSPLNIWTDKGSFIKDFKLFDPIKGVLLLESGQIVVGTGRGVAFYNNNGESTIFGELKNRNNDRIRKLFNMGQDFFGTSTWFEAALHIWNSEGKIVKTFKETHDLIVCGKVWKNGLRYIIHGLFLHRYLYPVSKIAVSTYDSDWNLLERTDGGVSASCYHTLDDMTYAAVYKDNEIRIITLDV
jgi:hypothetical protein